MQAIQTIHQDATALVAAMAADSAKLGDRAPFLQTIAMAATDLTGANADLLAETVQEVKKARTFDKARKAAEKLQSIAADLAQGEEEAAEKAPETPSLTLKQITGRVHTQLKKGQEAARQAGYLLRDAKGHFDSAGAWLQWAESEFGLKKTHTYRLVKIAETFGANEAFDGVDAHALRILIDGKTDAEKMEEAEKLAATGNLNPQTARQLVGDSEPDKAKGAKEQRAEETAEMLEQNRALAKQNEELSGLIEELRQQLANKAETAKKTPATMPMLPQFDSDAMHIRLGLTEKEGGDIKKVRAAYRALVKYWNEDSNPAAFAALTEAADALRFPA